MSYPKATNIPERSPELDEEKIDHNSPTEKEQRNGDEEVLMEIPTYNFTLLFCTMMAGLGLGYIVWVFVEKELILWVGAVVGLLIGRWLEITVFPQNVVRIWMSKNSIEMTREPNWREAIQPECDFFVQSDMYDLEKHYVRSTAVYHYPNTNAITVHERFVKRRSLFRGNLFMNTPIGGAIGFIFGMAASAIWYLRKNVSEQVSLFIVAFIVLTSLIVLVGCLVEVELRKRRFLSFNLAYDLVTNIPLHTIGQVERKTFGSDCWRWLYLPPQARNNWSRTKLFLKLTFGPLLVVYRFVIVVVLLTTYNGALSLFLWEWLATMLVYQAHVNKKSEYLEPAMAILWLCVLINLFELWYCSWSNGRVDSFSFLGTATIRRLELDSATRIPKDKVKKLFISFLVSLVLLLLASILMTAVTDNVLEDIVIYNFDKSWENNYKENEKFIMCKANDDDSSNSTRRLMGVRTDIKTKYESDYDALCSNRTKYALTGAVVFCSLDWVLLLFMAVYWTINDKYQTEATYDNSQMVWHEYSTFDITFVPSKITWIGRVLGRQMEKTFFFFILPAEAEQIGLFLVNNVPWYSHLDPKTPMSKELLPRHTDVDTDDQVPRGLLAAYLRQ